MKLPGWGIVTSLAFVFGVLLSSIFIFSKNYIERANTSENEITPVENINGKGQVGYVIIKTSSVYFVKEEDLPDIDVENINWEELDSFMGHPSDSILHGESIVDILDALKTGDKVEIWYSIIDESYPARIEVTKIQKL